MALTNAIALLPKLAQRSPWRGDIWETLKKGGKHQGPPKFGKQ